MLGSDVRVRDLGEHRLKDLSAPERLYQLGDREFPPLTSLWPHQSPVPATAFLGRERELAEVAGLLQKDGVRLLTLTGSGRDGEDASRAAGRGGAFRWLPGRCLVGSARLRP